ncbi:hypothetical protein ABMA27_014494 [Loxostege sticticalis]|uniref:CIDE-N domain-containing protein n=1 Tax=Loxostege sticticalis TaxID=481309 RepID=A0ABR3I986_LOXSC
MKKGYKVTDVQREKKIGVAAENLEELILKSCKKLGFNVEGPGAGECRLFVAEDGTRVDDDDYLGTLPPQTLFILLKSTETMVTDFDFYYKMIRSTRKEFIDTGAAAHEFLSTDIKEKFKVFQRYIAAASDAKTMLSERVQDPTWFQGLEPSEKTKEQSMSKRVKERMKGYYYKTKSALQSSELNISSKNSRDYSINAPPTFKPTKKYSDISGLPAPYVDRHSKLYYSNADEFATVRSLPMDITAGYLQLRGANIIVG